jgi:hypothetical protein
MPNDIATLALLMWAPLSVFLFSRYPAPLAASFSIVGATALLPSGFAYDLPPLPPLDRDAIAGLGSMAGCAMFASRHLKARRPGSGLEVLALIMVAGTLATAMANGDAVTSGGRIFRGLRLYDGVVAAIQVVLGIVLPFYIGRIVFRRPADLWCLLWTLAAGGLLYSVLVLWEVRMSPHIHDWVYGYQPGLFRMAKRGTLWGWRPMVFVGHGISLTMLVLSCTVAAAALWRVRSRVFGLPGSFVAPYLLGVLFACQSLGSLVYGIAAVPMLVYLRPRLQSLALTGIALIVLTYPVSRALDVFPTDSLVRLAQQVSEERAASLQFRFTNEDILIDRALERPLFGWGAFGRNRVYSDSGRSAVVTDGYWIIVFSVSGAIGFVCAFGLLTIPTLRAARAIRRHQVSREMFLVLGVGWVAALSGTDLLPNGFLNARTFFVAGALTGALEGWAFTRPVKNENPKPFTPSVIPDMRSERGIRA